MYLEISMRDSNFMQILQQIDNLGNIEHFSSLGQFIKVCFNEINELSPLTIFLNKVEGCFILERVAKFDDSWMFEICEKLFLYHRLVFFLLALELPLLDLLQGIYLMVTVFNSQEHIAIGSLPQSMLDREVINGDPFAGSAGSHWLYRGLVTYHDIDQNL